MKKNLFFLFATSLFLAFTPAKDVSIKKVSSQTSHVIVHSFHVVTTGSDAVSYYVTLDFNLSTQSFGVITAHRESSPLDELDATLASGSGSTLGGNGSTIVTTGVVVSIDNTSVTITIPNSTYTFDY